MRTYAARSSAAKSAPAKNFPSFDLQSFHRYESREMGTETVEVSGAAAIRLCFDRKTCTAGPLYKC